MFPHFCNVPATLQLLCTVAPPALTAMQLHMVFTMHHAGHQGAGAIKLCASTVLTLRVAVGLVSMGVLNVQGADKCTPHHDWGKRRKHDRGKLR